MKRIFILIVTVAFFSACSVEDQDAPTSGELFSELNATYVSNGCTVTTYDFGELGFIEVRNDLDFLYITIRAEGSNVISNTTLHIADNFNQLPVVGKGNLQPNRMEYQQAFEVGVPEYAYQFPLSDFGGTVVIASYTTFNGVESYWAGDISVKQGNWTYFNYDIKPHPVNAGPDNSRTMSVSEATALPSWDEVRKVYAGMLAPGVDRKSGTYNPSIWSLINDFNDPDRTSKVGEYTTVYTLGTGDCTDSVTLTLKVVPDEEKLAIN